MSARRRSWLSIADAQPRPSFAVADMRQNSEIQRVVSYTSILILTVVLDISPVSRAVAAGLCVYGGGRAVYALRHSGRAGRVSASLIDMVISPVIVALGTGSTLFAFGAAAGIATLTIAAYEVPVVAMVLSAMVTGSVGAVFVRWWPGGTAELDRSTLLILAAAVTAISFIGVIAGKTRKALQRSQVELGTVLESTPVQVITIDENRRIAGVSGGWADTTWRVGDRMEACFSPAMLELVEEAISGGGGIGDVTVDGRDLEVTVRPSATDVTVIAYDVTDRETARRDLEKLMRTKDEFVAAISHELRTPLTAVLGFAQTLQGAASFGSKERQHVEVVADQALEMAAIIEDLLVAVRADLGTLTILSEPLDLLFESESVVRGLTAKCSCLLTAEGKPVWALADPLRVRQILRNLITNADRYGGENVRLLVFGDDGYPTVEVRDDGPPIEDSHREAMFLPYESAGPLAGRPSAIGLGLHVSQRLAEMMNGTIAYDHDGRESIFSLTLPPHREGSGLLD